MALTRPNITDLNTNVAVFNDNIMVASKANPNTRDSGILIDRSAQTPAASNVAIIFKESLGGFQIGTTSGSGVDGANLTISGNSDLYIGSLTVSGSISYSNNSPLFGGQGNDTNFQYNDAGVIRGSNNFNYVKATGQILANAGISSTDSTTGTMVVTGGVGVSGNLNVGGGVVIAGNLTVEGTTTTVDSTVVTVNDKNITVANNQVNSAGIDTAGIDAGVNGGTPVSYWRYADSTTSWGTANNVVISGYATTGLYITASGGVQNTPIGNTTASSGRFTTLAASSTLNIGGTATVNALTSNGAVTGTTGTFTTSTTTSALATGTINANGTATVNALTSNGTVTATAVNAATIGNTGAAFSGKDITLTGNVVSANVNAAIVGNVGAAVYGATVSAATIGNAAATIQGQTGSFTGTVTAATVNAATIGNASASIVGGSVSAATIGNTGATFSGASGTLTGTLAAATVNAATIGNSGAALTGASGIFTRVVGVTSVEGPIVGANTGAFSTINTTSTATVNALTSNGAVTGTTGTFTTSTTTNALNTGTINANSTATVASLVSNGAISGTAITGTGTATLNAVVTGTINANGTATVNALTSNGAVTGTTGTFTTSTTTSALATGTLNANGTATVNALTSNGAINTATLTTTGDATVGGNLSVLGTLTTINSTTVTVNDKNILVANNQTTSAGIDGAGIDAGDNTGTPVSYWRYSDSLAGWNTANNMSVGGTLSTGGTATLNAVVTGTINANGTATVNALTSNGAVSGTTGTFTTKVTTANLATGPINANGTITVAAVTSNGAIAGTTIDGTNLHGSGTLNIGGTATVNALTSNGAVTGTTGTFTTSVTTSAVATGTLNANANATVNGLTVNNSATIGTTLGVTGNVTVGNLEVQGKSILTGGVTGNLTATGNVIGAAFFFANGDPVGAQNAEISSNIQTADGVATQFNIPSSLAKTAEVLVSINGVVQQPVTSYSANAGIVTFTEAPLNGDSLEFRILATGKTIYQFTDTYGNTKLQLDRVVGDGNVWLASQGNDIAVINNNGIQIEKGGIISNTATITVGTIGGTIDSFDGTKYSAAKYVISARNSGSDTFTALEALVATDGASNVVITTYGAVTSGATDVAQITVGATISTGTVTVTGYGAATGTVVRISKTYIETP